MASNNSGVWNEAGASFDFSIDPAYYQTAWFQASCAAACLGVLWAVNRYRLHQIAQQFNAQLEARVGERTRIARDLHDTLLQSFQGLLLRFQVVDESLPPGKAKEEFERALDLAALAITEGRDTVQGLRSSTVETNDLARAIGALGEELAGDQTNPNRAECSVEVEGTLRDLHPILRDEVYRIAGRRCATLSGMHRRGGSRWLSGMASGSFDYVFVTMERASTRRCLRDKPAPDTLACLACASAPNSLAVSWRSGASGNPARRSS
jgi:signal transduction histidine kinase